MQVMISQWKSVSPNNLTDNIRVTFPSGWGIFGTKLYKFQTHHKAAIVVRNDRVKRNNNWRLVQRGKFNSKDSNNYNNNRPQKNGPTQ